MTVGIKGSRLVTPAAIASRDWERARSMAERLDIPTWYADYRDLWSDPNIDAIYIPLPITRSPTHSPAC